MKTTLRQWLLFLSVFFALHARAGYDPAIQRWISLDPIGERGGLNLYGFVGNNPLNFYDPYGLAFGDTLDWCTYSPAYARAQGVMAIKEQLKNAGYDSMQEFQWAHPKYGGTITAGDTASVKAGAAAATEMSTLYVAAATSVTPTAAGARLVGLLMPGGKTLGQAGSDAVIRELQGGVKEAQALFDQLSHGGSVVVKPRYKGTWIELPNGGGGVGLRTEMTKSPGTAATIDLKIPNVPIEKIKFNPCAN